MTQPFRPFDPKEYVARVHQSAHLIRARIGDFPTPLFSLTLGSGLADLVARMDVQHTFPYRDVGLPEPTVADHAGVLHIGTIAGVPVAALSGRTHYYEVSHLPHGIMEVVFATHVMASLGVQTCFTTNAVGGLNPPDQRWSQSVGDLLIVRDHISLIPNPISGPHLDFGDNPYFQPLHEAYPQDLQLLFQDAVDLAQADRHRGVYLAVPGRTYETAAECRMYRAWGASVVGMSTAPEIIAAVNRGMRTLAVSIITNVIAKDGTNATNHEEVTATLENPMLREKLANAFFHFFVLCAKNPDRYAAARV